MGSSKAVAVDELSKLDLLAGVVELDEFAAKLERIELDRGEIPVRHGDPSSTFALVGGGSLEISDREGAALAVAETGSIIGELGVASGRPRRATAVVTAPAILYVGERDAFESLLAMPGMRRRLQTIAATRLAEVAPDVSATLRDGADVYLRPLLATDRPIFTSQLRRWSGESLRRRFFTAAPPSEDLIRYLVEIDYVDHFAWAVADRRAPGLGLGTARYVRSGENTFEAEVAFGVDEQSRGRGIATLLLGALGAAADCAGISRFTAELLTDNEPMRTVLGKADAQFHAIDAVTLSAVLDVAATRSLIPSHLAEALAAVARDVVTAAGLALVRTPSED